MPELRKCKDCNETKELENNFYKTGKSKKTGGSTYRHKCKTCMNSKISLWKKENPNRHKSYCDKWVERNRDYYKNYKMEYHILTYDPDKRHDRHIAEYIRINPPHISV